MAAAYQLHTVISGGQTGVDQIGLRVAREYGYDTGGFAPKGWRTDEGPAPWLKQYGLAEAPTADYALRTIRNVQIADATVWWGDVLSPGGQLTKRTAAIGRQPFCENPDGAQLFAFLREHGVETLNVAGNRRRINPAASRDAERALRACFELTYR